MDGLQNTQGIAYLKLINGEFWIEFLTGCPLNRDAIRKWIRQFEGIKDDLRAAGYNEIFAGCSDEHRVKYAVKIFGFEKVKEYPMGTVVHMCF